MAKKSKHKHSTKMKAFGSARDYRDQRDRAFRQLGKPAARRKPSKARAIVVAAPRLPVWQQLPLSSCTSQAVAGAIWHMLGRRNAKPIFEPSRLFIYYHSLLYQRDENVAGDPSFPPTLEATAEQGVGIRSALKAAARYGACEEAIWAHPALDVREWDDPEALEEDRLRLVDAATYQALSATPDARLYQSTLLRGVKVKKYSRLSAPNVNAITRAISLGHPVIFSFEVYPSFNSAAQNGGHIEVPGERELRGPSLGEHAMVAVGFDAASRTILARNSFGPLWGDNGYAHVPYAFFPKQILDAWIIEKIALTKDGVVRQVSGVQPRLRTAARMAKRPSTRRKPPKRRR